MITKFKLFENTEYKLDMSELTLNQWGGFEIGDGEFFVSEKELFSRDEPDMYIKVIKENNLYKTYFVPSKDSYQKYLNGEIDEYYKDLYYNISEYVANEQEIIDYAVLKDDKKGMYQYEIINNIVEMDDALWFYLSYCESGTLTLLETKNHPLFKETQELRKKYEYVRSSKKFKI